MSNPNNENNDREHSMHYKKLVAQGYQFEPEYHDEYVEDRMVHSCRRITNLKYAVTPLIILIGGIIGVPTLIGTLVHFAIQYYPI